MSFSLPGNDLYYLPRDDLSPERYEEITSPVFSWSRIKDKYVFNDRQTLNFKLINMYERDFNGYTNQPPPHGPREQEKLQRMVFSGEVVMLGGFSFAKGRLFYIDEHGALICRDPLAFKFDGARAIIREYNRSVARRDYRKRGGKPRPTVLPARQTQIKQPTPLSTINSKAAGRLLAAGGIYNGNPEGFRLIAQQLGGEAPAGYDQIMSDQTKGLLITGASIAAGLTMGRIFPEVFHSSIKTKSAAVKAMNKIEGERVKLKNFGNVSDFIFTQSANLNRKLGVKIGQGRLPYEASKAGIEQAKEIVKETLENATQISTILPSSSVRGKYDLIHVYSEKTNSTVSLRVLSDDKYDFDTLIPERSSKF
ncbi:hypothetical protein [Pantoea sp. FN0305]|uniref:hypothetical protein n=1 Tax=Pantoea sp. FN0305 TaxID=3418559 RepID=UPI003CEBEB43